MKLHESNLIIKPDIAHAEDVHALCVFAKQLEEGGEFEQAYEALRPVWSTIGKRPDTDALSPEVKAELLLRAGTLTGWLGSSRQIAGAQDLAKDLISESAGIFRSLGLREKEAEAQVDLSICYWREGALDEARITLKLVLESLDEDNGHSEQRLRALLNSAIVEKVATREFEALRIYREASPLFAESSNHALRGKFHNSYATLLRSLGTAEEREDYIDSALMEYTAASFHFEQAGHRRFQGRVENNVGYLFANLGKFGDAHEHFDRAHSLLSSVGDFGGAAGCDDARAQAFLLEGRNSEAQKAAATAVKVLSRGEEQTMLAEALTTQGKAYARLNQSDEAKTTLDQAIDVGKRSGDLERGGIAALCVIEELDKNLSGELLLQYYRTAESLLEKSQNRGIKTRLCECARRILSHHGRPTVGKGFSLEAEVLRYEGSLIRAALEKSGGSVTRAARLLGVTHQGLAFILNGRHSDLLSIRTPIRPRRKSIIKYH